MSGLNIVLGFLVAVGTLIRDECLAVPLLFAVLLAHGAVCTGASGNPAVTVTRLLLDDGTAAAAALGVAGQILGAHLGLVVARRYWALEMTDLHVIKALMGAECSTALRSSPAQGFCVEAACGATFTLLHLGLRRKPALLRVPALAATLTFLSHAARNYTSGVANPALAYALTFRCSGFSFTQYALVYWLGTLAGATLAVFLYVGHVPRLFSKNLLYSRKGRVRGPRGRTAEKHFLLSGII
uniref:Aquaporin n=1 Tax=Denticeps clupeoides TaxID=299321 RepID=A0AAY4C2B1_9TELE